MNLRLVTSRLHDSRLAIGLGSAALALSILLAAPVLAQDEPTTVDPQVVIETSKGDIVVELFAQEAPKSTANFLEYVDAGFYDGTIFHRVIPSFMIQGGGFSSDMKRKETRRAITNEADNGLRNERGTLAMARTGDPHSATAQFYVNTVDNRPLDHTAKTPRGWGYAVFGKVVSGMDVVDSISNVRTKSFGGMRDVPVEPITIVKAYRKPAQESAD